jgi:hypothetical protein
MNLEGARRVMETESHETANQYLRFGWKLINQYVVDATADHPRMVKYVLASISRLEDTREVIVLSDPQKVNQYLAQGWKLIDKHVSGAKASGERDETLHFTLAWQTDDAPAHPGSGPAVVRHRDTTPVEVDDL